MVTYVQCRHRGVLNMSLVGCMHSKRQAIYRPAIARQDVVRARWAGPPSKLISTLQFQFPVNAQMFYARTVALTGQ